MAVAILGSQVQGDASVGGEAVEDGGGAEGRPGRLRRPGGAALRRQRALRVARRRCQGLADLDPLGVPGSVLGRAQRVW